MKKLNYIFATLSLLAVMTSCEDYNTRNFPGYSDLESIKNVATYTYQLTGADFEAIGNTLKKPIDNLITAQSNLQKNKENELKNAINHTDSLRIQSELDTIKINVSNRIAILKLDTNYVAGMALINNKYLSIEYPVAIYAPKFLNNKYKFADVGSSVLLTYKYRNDADTLSITNPVNKYTLLVTDYDALGEGDNQPGKSNYFNSKIDPDVYIPRLLLVKYPLGQKGDLRMIKYTFNNGTANTNTYTIYLCTGSNWVPFSKTEQFVFTSSLNWEFDPTIIFEPLKPDYLGLMIYMHDHDGERIPFLEGYNDWTENDTARFVINTKYPLVGDNYSSIFTEFFFGTAQNYANIDMYITKRIYSNDTKLQAYFTTIDNDVTLDAVAKKDAKTAFMEKRVKQGLSLLLSLKYPDLETQVKGIDQHVKVRVQLYDGNRWYWEYNYKCIEKGKFEYIERLKWK